MKSLKRQIKHNKDDYTELNCLSGIVTYRVQGLIWFNISYVVELQIKNKIKNKIKNEIIKKTS